MLRTCVTATCLLASSALAQEVPEQSAQPGNTKSPPLWEAGLFGFGYSQPAYPGAEDRASRALVFPYIIYRGKYLRAERGGVGVRAFNTPRAELDIGFSASLGSRSSDIPVRHGMGDLGIMIEFGPRLKIKLGSTGDGNSDSRLQFPLREVFDISHGFSSRGIAFEPQWVTDTDLPNQWSFSTSLGALMGDSRLASTFYGVAPSEATPSRPSYTAQAGLIALRAGLFASHSLTPDVRLFQYVRIESLAGATNRDSPLVSRNSGWSAGIGFAWGLAHSEASAMD